jgi:hypothetical protein
MDVFLIVARSVRRHVVVVVVAVWMSSALRIRSGGWVGGRAWTRDRSRAAREREIGAALVGGVDEWQLKKASPS